MSRTTAHALACALACTVLAACGENREEVLQTGLGTLNDWFAIANSGARGDEHCHAFGLLKHPEASCDDMLEHASRVDGSQRRIESAKFIECLESVCGEFLQVELSSVDRNEDPITEIAVLKRDEGNFRLYWYRTDSLLTALFPDDELEADEPDPDEAAYTLLTNQHPGLYQFPLCLDIRVSSSNMIGALTAPAEVDVADFEQRSQRCPDDFCLAFVGKKVAGVCQ